jgi:copper chaperone
VETKTFSVPGIHCAHCDVAVRRELDGIRGVAAVDVDLEAKVVAVTGVGLEAEALLAAIDEAGYDAVELAAR